MKVDWEIKCSSMLSSVVSLLTVDLTGLFLALMQTDLTTMVCLKRLN